MSGDSDAEFERFLQEDDSESVSFASPVKRKPSKRAANEAKASSRKSSASSAYDTKSKPSKTKGSSAGGASLSVVAAAEKLLAASGRVKTKSKPVVQDDDEEEPPPPYSDDPYAFDLDATSSHYRRGGDDDDGSSQGSDRRSSKTMKGKNDKAHGKLKMEKAKEKAVVAIRESKPAKTLEERMAEILKRTRSTTVLSTGAEEKKADSEAEDMDEDDRSERSAGHADEAGDTSRKTNRAGKDKDTSYNRSESKDEDLSDEESEAHRLEFSDSLELDSADFGVGIAAKRRLDRSRLSLSSLNSEKFAVNLDALEGSELDSNPRYGRQDTDLRHSVGTSDREESDYDDEGFELDQTTDKMPNTATPSTPRNDPTTNSPDVGSFVSEFEKMKSLFSLESPTKSPQPTERSPSLPATTTVVEQAPPQYAELDTFGYDDEDFENEDGHESNRSPDDELSPGNAPTTVSTTPQKDGVDEYEEYEDESFERDEKQGISSIDEEREHSANDTGITNPSEAQGSFSAQHESVNAFSQQHPPDHPESPLDENQPAKDEGLQRHQMSLGEEQAPSQVHPSHNPLQSAPHEDTSPPPPPPPEDDCVTVSVAHYAEIAQKKDAKVDTSINRLRAIEDRVASLRFFDSSSQSSRVHAEPKTFPPNAEISIVDEAEMAVEMEEFERLISQARNVRRERRRSVELRSSSKETELALRLHQAQRQLLQFKQQVQELAKTELDDSRGSSQSSTSAHPADAHANRLNDAQRKNSHAVDLKKENERLHKEVSTQERLIQGFQRENEQLMVQVKHLQRDLSYDVHRENESLRSQLKELRLLLDGSANQVGGAVENIGQYRMAIEARLHAEALAASLHEELDTQSKRHQDRINELKVELEKVKKAKIDMECRYERLDLQKVQAENQQVKILQEQLQMQKTEHDHTIAGLQKKIDWYVANQRLLDEQDDLVTALKDENKRLKAEVEKQREKPDMRSQTRQPDTPVKPGVRSAADIRRIQELEARLSDMEEAMRKRHPDSLVSLIVASRKADEQSKITIIEEERDRRLAEMAAEMEQQQILNEKKLNAFRQQQEKLISQYQKQIRHLEKQLSNKGNQRAGAASTKSQRTKLSVADEMELHRVRRFYAEKIKEVERKWEAKYRAAKKQHYAATGATETGTAEHGDGSPADTARIIRRLQLQLKLKENELSELRAHVGSAPDESTYTDDASALRRRVASLENQLKTSEDARRHLVETISSLSTMVPPPAPSSSVGDGSREHLQREFESRIQHLKKEHTEEIRVYREKLATLEHQLAEQSKAGQSLHNQLVGHIKEVERQQKLMAEAEREKRMLKEAAERIPALESELATLRDQVAVPQTPSMLEFRSLELRIETLTQKHQLREAELQTLLAQATQSSRLEKLNFEHMYNNAIALKNAEINKFKTQLEEILDELELLRHSRPTR